MIYFFPSSKRSFSTYFDLCNTNLLYKAAVHICTKMGKFNIYKEEIKQLTARFRGDPLKRNIVILLSLIYSFFMIVMAVYYFYDGETKKAMVGVGGAICGVVPLGLGLLFKLKFNLPLVLSYLIFLFGSQYLGSI